MKIASSERRVGGYLRMCSGGSLLYRWIRMAAKPLEMRASESVSKWRSPSIREECK